MFVAEGWKDFELLDSGEGEKLERWGDRILRRPDPQATWPKDATESAWNKADATYRRSSSGGGRWNARKEFSQDANWVVGYGSMKLGVSLMRFKHTGVFPEQAANWRWMEKVLKDSGKHAPKVLNLFAYTGAATVALALAGASVCHVDSSKGMAQKAKENARMSRVPENSVRYIVDDVNAFVAREVRRGKKYDAVVMDPPAYGRGPSGELWKVESDLYRLVDSCAAALCEAPLFFVLSSYAAGITPVAAGNIVGLALTKRFGGRVEGGELVLRARSRGLALPCGCSVRWSKK